MSFFAAALALSLVSAGSPPAPDSEVLAEVARATGLAFERARLAVSTGGKEAAGELAQYLEKRGTRPLFAEAERALKAAKTADQKRAMKSALARLKKLAAESGASRAWLAVLVYREHVLNEVLEPAYAKLKASGDCKSEGCKARLEKLSAMATAINELSATAAVKPAK